MLQAAEISAALNSPLSVTLLDETASTNAVAKELAASGAPSGSVVLARRQTAGRGRLTRSFLSPEGGIYLSLILRPTKSTLDATRLTMAAAVAVCRALKTELGLDAGIKWVNDIYLNGKKICGILAEGSSGPDGLNYAVIGVGLNYAVPAFSGELAFTAASLYPNGNAPVSISRMAAALINELMRAYECPAAEDISREYREKSVVVGHCVRLLRTGGGTAYAYDISPDGKLLVRHADGRLEALFSGEVSVVVE